MENKQTELENRLDVRVYPLDNPNNLTKAFASLAIDDLIAIRGIRIIEGAKGFFVAMPQSKDHNGQYHDIAFPLTKELRQTINTAILDEFKEVTNDLDKSVEAVQEAKSASKAKSAPKAAQDDLAI